MSVNTRQTSSSPPVQEPEQETQKSVGIFCRPDQIAMFARVTSYPPLGQLTNIRRSEDDAVSIELSFAPMCLEHQLASLLENECWDAQIWHNITNSEWTALPLLECQSEQTRQLNGIDSSHHYHRHVRSAKISLPGTGGHAQFTVRFRTSPDEEWQWANQKHAVSDGEIVYCSMDSGLCHSADTGPSARSPLEEIAKYITNFSDKLQIQPRRSEAPGSKLWDISGGIDPSQEGKSNIKYVTLGTPLSVLRYFSLVRVWSPWLGPRHGTSKFRLNEDVMLCSFLRSDGAHLVLLAVSGVNDVLTILQSGDDGEIIIKAKSDNEGTSEFHILVAVAEEFEIAMSAVMYEARKVVKPFADPADADLEDQVPLSPPGDDEVLVEKDPSVQFLAQWYDGLTYCTWNALGQDLTEQKILNALAELKSNGIQIANLIIDDGWQANDNEGQSQFKRGLCNFEAHLEGFPKGLKHTVGLIRDANPKIEHIAVWHALFGYWGGISPEGDLAKKYKTKEVKIKDPTPNGPVEQNLPDGKILVIDPDDVQTFYDDFYSYLDSTGIDSVKADSQFFIDLLEEPEDRRRFMTSYQDAWSIASLRHFSTRSISCGSMTPQIIFHSQLPNNKPTIPLRNSDDFFPEIPASHPWHVFCNAHNSLLTRYLNVVPDWDMFQTSHPYASFHAAARCVSGGPIYITDQPGKHDLDLLNQITAPTVNDITIILRPSVIGRTIDTYHGYNEGNILRVGSYTGWARTGSGILGLFNITSSEASTMISLMDFPGIHDDSQGYYIVRAHSSGKVSARMRPIDQDSLVSIILDQKGWEILTAYPTQSFTLKNHQGGNGSLERTTHVAVLGLLGKMTGAAAVVMSDIFIAENGRLRIDIRLKALGVIGIYMSDLPERTIAQDFMVMIQGKPIPKKTVWKEGGKDVNVLAIDVLTAWKTMKLDSGWSNEVFVQVFVG
ncbi:uncharacterized protein N7511_006630 [Penicillium nucicola]|uniref:uncharacterized protein n=1 Tax=Penicillium nucicola TaxID=1850975 RepID=UPI002544E0F7|nr:uncharacterized protein N7511_006630 [Penicillium nucicola]KAJ5757936.1 hypothetical protein N7511_006630 [Penicillium nucicola]